MKRSYDTEIAKRVGINAAKIYEYLEYWSGQDTAEVIDGQRWIFRSARALHENFTDMSEKTIRRSLKKLEDEGLIKTGNFNKIPFDKTKWYCVLGVHFDVDKMSTSIRTKCPHDVDKMSTSDVDKMSTSDVDKVSTPITTIENYRTTKETKLQKGNFIPPTVEEVKAYCDSRSNSVDPEAFVAFYQSKGWKVGKDKMKDWRAAVITWEKRRRSETVAKTSSNPFTELKKQRGWL